MKNKIYLILILFLGGFLNHCFADETITIDIWDHRTVNYWDTVNINAVFSWSCSNFDLSTTYFMELNDRSDWVTIQSWWTGNILYSFTATWSKQVRWEIRCPQGTWWIFNSEITANEIINITVNPLSIPTVNAWSNTSYNSWDTVNLSGSIIWADPSCSIFNYQWEQINWIGVEIINSWSISESTSYTGASFIFPDTTESVQFRLNVTPESCANAWNTYSGTVTFSKQSSWWWGWSSYSSRMRWEAESLFYDTGSIEKINLKLKLEKQDYSPILKFYWDGIWWNWQVNYILEYSTGSNFSTWNTLYFNTTESFYQFIEYWLDINSYTHYFRIKSEYYWKQSKYSNIIKYYTEDYVKIACNNSKLPNFDDVFDYDDSFIDDYFKVKCTKCNKKQKQNF